MSIFTINGVTYQGSNISVQNGKIIVNGVDVTPESKHIIITINGNVESVKVDSCEKVSIVGDVGGLSTVSADVEIDGNVNGSVKTVSGSVECENVGGNVSTVSGKIKYK